MYYEDDSDDLDEYCEDGEYLSDSRHVQEYSKEAFAKKIEKIYQEQRYLEKTYEW